MATAVQCDGPSASLTAPNGSAQRRLIDSVRLCDHKSAGLTTPLEAHGTGTSLGDPIEVGATISALSDASIRSSSLKANMGHLESAASGGGILSLYATSLEMSFTAASCQLRVFNPHLASI